MTDPFFPQHPKAWKRENTPLPDLEHLGTIDYVVINHSHFDHTAGLPDVFRGSNPVVICDRMFARELSAAYQIPEYNIFPFVPGMTYDFPDFRLDTISGKHGSIGSVCDLEGKDFADPQRPFVGRLNSYGCLFNTNFLFTLMNGFRIGFVAGVDVDTAAKYWKRKEPNLLLRQRMCHEKPQEYAEECCGLGGQMVLPMHHDACDEENQDMNVYTQNVNRLLDGTGMCMFNPKRLKWYSVKMQISIE